MSVRKTAFTPYEKLSKKAKREIDAKKRGSWNGVDPVTKIVESKKVYRRKGRRVGEDRGVLFVLSC